MKRRNLLAAFAGMAGGQFLQPSIAQEAKSPPGPQSQLLGAWTFVQSISIKDSRSRTDNWGPGATGLLIFDPSGHFAEIIDRPRSGLSFRKAFYCFGTYSVETGKTIVLKIEGSNRQSIIGTRTTFEITRLDDSELHYLNPKTYPGEQFEVVWRRSK